jgi:hypothetical protein
MSSWPRSLHSVCGSRWHPTALSSTAHPEWWPRGQGVHRASSVFAPSSYLIRGRAASFPTLLAAIEPLRAYPAFFGSSGVGFTGARINFLEL